MEVPEAILVDVDSTSIDEAAQRVFVEEKVQDVNEMKDLVEGYRAQNHFLNQEIVGELFDYTIFLRNHLKFIGL